MSSIEAVTILEVGPRDGFQGVKQEIPTEDKVRIVDFLAGAGLKRIEVSSFVHPKWIPQLKDAAEVFAKIHREPEVSYSALIPNEKGLDRAIENGVREVVYVVSASDTVSRQAFNKSTSDVLTELLTIAEKAAANNISLRGIIGCSFGSPVDGEVTVGRVIEIAKELEKAGVFEISLADSFGIANPRQVRELVSEVLGEVSNISVSVHFHNMRSIGLANVYSALEAGVNTFESSIAGLGGDPLTPQAPGNVATEDVVKMFDRMGIVTGVDLDRLLKCSKIVEETLRRISASDVGDN
jgi:hydroxymethylglutaryl-CoA lyase